MIGELVIYVRPTLMVFILFVKFYFDGEAIFSAN